MFNLLNSIFGKLIIYSFYSNKYLYSYIYHYMLCSGISSNFSSIEISYTCSFLNYNYVIYFYANQTCNKNTNKKNSYLY